MHDVYQFLPFPVLPLCLLPFLSFSLPLILSSLPLTPPWHLGAHAHSTPSAPTPTHPGVPVLPQHRALVPFAFTTAFAQSSPCVIARRLAPTSCSSPVPPSHHLMPCLLQCIHTPPSWCLRPLAP